MKKILIVYVLLCTILFTMAGCAESGISTLSTDASSMVSTTKSANNSSEASSTQSINNQDQYSDIYFGEISPEFENFILLNPIDKSFEEGYPDTGVTIDMIKYESKYADIWKEEMEYSIQNLAAILTDEDRKELLDLQNIWFEWISQNLLFEHSLLINQDYGMRQSSLFLVTQRSAYKNAYRKRTFQIKYIHYLLETGSDNPKSIDECDSLKLLFSE